MPLCVPITKYELHQILPEVNQRTKITRKKTADKYLKSLHLANVEAMVCIKWRRLTTSGQSYLTKGRIAVRTNPVNVYNAKTFNLNSVKFTQLVHH